MDLGTIGVGLLFALILVHAFQSLTLRGKKLPPGPAALPLIGNLHLLGALPHQSLARLASTYGPLMRLRLGLVDTIVVSSADVAKQVLQKHDLAFSGRAIPDALHAHSHFKFSVVWLPVAAPRWRSLRKAMNSNIFSAGRLDANEELRRRKVEELIAYCAHSASAVDLGSAVFTATLNSLSNTVFSTDLTDSAKEFKQLVSSILEEAGKPNLVDFFPFLARLDPQGIRRRMTVYFGKVIHIFSGLIDQRLSQDTEETNDVLDVLLNNPQEIDRTHIERLCLDLFVAGTDTSTGTVEWAMAEALRNPEILKKAKAELEEVIGRGKLVQESDISRLPYLQCMVKETMRLHPPVPFLIPRKVDQDVDLLGHTVLKDSHVLVNVWAIGRDPAVWENPLEFEPHRFLGSQLDVRGRDFELTPFGAGRRICPGLPLAMRMVPVMLGSLINAFDWEVEGGKLSMEEKFGITLVKAQPLRAVPIPLATTSHN